MGAAVAPIAAAASFASVGLSAYGSYEKGKGEQAADQYQASRLERAAQYGKVQAAQTGAQGLENLNLTLDNIDAVRAAGNVDPSSPTTAALRARTTYLGERDTNIRVGNILAQANQDVSDAAYLRSAGEYALGMGRLSAMATVAKGVGQTNFSSFGAPS